MPNSTMLYTDNFIKGITTITGISQRRLQKYAQENNIFNILEHPQIIEPSKEQHNKISILNEFIESYNLLKIYERDNKICFKSSAASGEYFLSMLAGHKDRERFIVAFVDNGNNLIEKRVMSEGGISEATIYPRDILKAALACDCKALILGHNHPGGSDNFSQQDIDLTQKLVAIFKPLDINILDHIVVGNHRYSSMAEKGYLPKHSNEKPSYEPFKLPQDDEIKESTKNYMLERGDEEWGI